MFLMQIKSIPQKGDKIPYIWRIDCQKVEVQYI